MSDPNLKAMTQAELFKYLEDDFMPRLLPKLANFQNLESENARLKADAQVILKHLVEASSDCTRLKAELDEYRKSATIAADSVIDERNNLKAEVERLRKAGDAMERSLAFEYPDSPKVKDWRAAKEGKPSEQKSPSFIEDLGNGVEKHDMLFRYPAKEGKQP